MTEPTLPESPGHRLEVSRVVEETADARSLVFTVPPESAEAFTYRPGQFLTLRIPGKTSGSVGRCYSLSSCPYTDEDLAVTVKRVADGYGSNRLCDSVTPGSTVEVLPPAGIFTPRSLDADFLLLAGGSGITPIRSILTSALHRGSGRIVLVYANRDQDSVIFADELARLARAHPDRLRVIHWLESVQGLPDAPALRALAEPFAEFEAFVCGPTAFMDAACAALRDLGLTRDRLHVERFLSLEDNPFERPDSSATSDDPAPEQHENERATVGVNLDGEEHEFRWPRDKVLLDLLLERGLDAPYSCRQGACSACACRIESGEVKMLHNQILEQEDLDEGVVLACQSLPVTDEVRVTYD